MLHRSRSSDDLLDIDFSQTSFPSLSSESTSPRSQPDSLQLSTNDVASTNDAEIKSQSAIDLRSSAAALPSSSLGICK